MPLTPRERMVAWLEAAIQAHETGRIDRIDDGFEEAEPLRRGAADNFSIAVDFWDGWIDSKNHKWFYYEPLTASDWPQLARTIVDDLRNDRPITDERILKQFDFTRPGPSLLERVRSFLGFS